MTKIFDHFKDIFTDKDELQQVLEENVDIITK